MIAATGGACSTVPTVTWQRGTAWASEFTVKVVAATPPNFTARACLMLVPQDRLVV